MSEIQKKIVALVKKKKRLNSNLACYENAASFEDALDLFFKNLSRDLKRLIKTHKLTTTTTSKRKRLKKKPIKKKPT
jgi:hypothetical protein